MRKRSLEGARLLIKKSKKAENPDRTQWIHMFCHPTIPNREHIQIPRFLKRQTFAYDVGFIMKLVARGLCEGLIQDELLIVKPHAFVVWAL
jgi:hypothetical protein